MNELIERLAKEAGFTVDRYKLWCAEADEIETFAKLVARECADIVMQFNVEGTDAIAGEIRERFGL